MAAAAMVDAITLDRKQVFPAVVRLDGEYGLRGLYAGVPSRLGRRGVDAIIEVELTHDETAGLHHLRAEQFDPSRAMSEVTRTLDVALHRGFSETPVVRSTSSVFPNSFSLCVGGMRTSRHLSCTSPSLS